MFRGREQSRPELGYRLLQKMAEEIVDYGVVESSPKQDGRNMIMVVAPTRKKAEAQAERHAARQAPSPESPAAQAAEPEAEPSA